MLSAKELIGKFTDFFQKDEDTTLYKLMALLSGELAHLKTTNNLILEWRSIDKAEGKILDLIGENINQARGKATDEVYRVLLKSKIARNLSDGTIDAVINIVAIALSTKPSDISIIEGWEKGSDRPSIVVSKIPLQKLLESGLDATNFVTILQKSVSAGVKVESVRLEGTLRLSSTVTTNQETGLGSVNSSTGGTLSALYVPDDANKLPI